MEERAPNFLYGREGEPTGNNTGCSLEFSIGKSRNAISLWGTSYVSSRTADGDGLVRKRWIHKR